MSFRPWLALPPKLAHDLAPYGLELASLVTRERDLHWGEFTWERKGARVQFRNPLGIAGGVDKDASQIQGWQHFGAGFVEIGTVTPRAQSPNPGRIIDRDSFNEALWNKMGFPNRGAMYAREQLLDWRAKRVENWAFPVFINIGKNRDTELEHATKDYVALIESFTGHESPEDHPTREIFVINISSPNTKGLRELFSPVRLRAFLEPIAKALTKTGSLGLLKLSPDLDEDSFSNAVRAAVDVDLDGFVATNTTVQRASGLNFPAEAMTSGGVSGAPLKGLSRAVLEKLVRELGSERKDRLIVSAGGVMTPDEVKHRLNRGADLVECYSALVFEGPLFFTKVAKAITI